MGKRKLTPGGGTHVHKPGCSAWDTSNRRPPRERVEKAPVRSRKGIMNGGKKIIGKSDELEFLIIADEGRGNP